MNDHKVLVNYFIEIFEIDMFIKSDDVILVQYTDFY